MCDSYFIAAKNPLPEVPYNNENPEFWIDRILGDHYIRDFFPEDFHIYEAISFMGCGCGFCFGDGFRNDDLEDHTKRINDVRKLKEFLQASIQTQKVLMIVWDVSDEGWFDPPFEIVDYKLAEIDFDAAEFYFSENRVLRIIDKRT